MEETGGRREEIGKRMGEGGWRKEEEKGTYKVEADVLDALEEARDDGEGEEELDVGDEGGTVGLNH